MSHTAAPAHDRILLGLVAGAVLGVAANLLTAGHDGAREGLRIVIDGVMHPIGQIFLRLLFLVVIPLVFASLACGVAGLGDLRKLGRMGARTLVFFLLTSGLSATLGITALSLVRPGAGFDPAVQEQLMAEYKGAADTLAGNQITNKASDLRSQVDVVLDVFLPRNLLRAVVDMQMVPLIVFALLFGAALTSLSEAKRTPVLRVLEGVGDSMVAIVGFAMRLAPIAVFCLIFAVVARFGLELLGRLSVFVLTVLGCYLIQLLGVYPVLLRSLARRSPREFGRGAMPVLLTAFSTSSSSATLPESIRVAETTLGMRPEVAGFVLPLGATMNMNGTALFEGAVVLFVAQVFGVELTLAQQVLVVALSVLTSIGAAGVPGGSLPLLMIVMAQVGVPASGIALVLGVDRLLDMGRTVINVAGDLVCAAWVDRGFARAADAGP